MPRKKKELTKEEKLKKEKNGEGSELEEQKEGLGSKLLLVFVTLLVIAIWLAIIALLIKTDVGGFGSTVLKPVLKDVPYLNQILPEGEDDLAVVDSEIDTQYMYDSLDDAVAHIKELEKELDSANEKIAKDKENITDLKEQVQDLSKYKEEQAAFEEEKEKFYEDVVFSDNAPDINEYKTYYESIEPENAAVLYKQVVEQQAASEEIEEYVKAYSSMKAKNAAAIFDTMTDNLSLVAEILENMEAASRGDILAEMTPSVAAQVTEIMDPDLVPDTQD